MRSLFVASSLLVACGPAVTYDTGSNNTGSGSGSGSAVAPPPSTAAGDESVEVPSIDVKGVLLEPAAFDTYGMAGADPKKKTTLEAERKTFASQKDILQKQAHAIILATMLFRESGSKTGADQKALLDEARQALRDAVAAAGPKQVDELALQLLARYEMMNADYESGAKAWEQLVTLFPKDKEVEVSRGWWAFCLLKQWKNAEALALVNDKSPEQTYVAAWAKYRTGDNAGAWAAMKKVLATWTSPAAVKDNSEREGVIRNEALRFAARTGTPLPDAQTTLAGVWGKQPGEVYELDKKLSAAMKFSGRWTDAIAANQAALGIGRPPPNEKVAILLENAQYQVKLDDPATSQKYATDAVNALPTCGQACTAQDAENVVETVFNIAARFHLNYAAANDTRYYQPAHDLYQLVLPKIMNTPVRQQAGDYSGKLESTKAVMKPNLGRVGKDVAANVINEHNQEVQACYESVLAANPKVAGNIVLTLDVEQSGAIKGASSDPKGGAQDLSAVAGCVVDRAKVWKLPARGSAGSTRIKITYATSLRKG